jgi:hypothetical protein
MPLRCSARQESAAAPDETPVGLSVELRVGNSRAELLKMPSIIVSSLRARVGAGNLMKQWVVIAVMGAAMALQPVSAAERARGDCYTQSAIEAEQAIRFLTDVMIISTTCQDTVYAEFRLRNRDPILAYQKAMIAHFHGTSGFENATRSSPTRRRRSTPGCRAPPFANRRPIC